MSFLGGLGSSLSGFAATDLQMKHDADDRKRQQEQIQFAALQHLLQQNDLPMDVYTHSIGALADLTGNKQMKTVADHLYQQLGQHQPIEQVTPQPAAPGTQASRVESAIGPPPPMTQVTHETIGEMPRNVYAARQLEPIKERERQATMKPIQATGPHGELVLLDPVTHQPIATPQGVQATTTYNVQTRMAAAKDRMAQGLENRLKIVDETYKQKAHQEVDRLVAGGMSPDDAGAYVLQKAELEQATRGARIELIKTQTNAIPQRTAQGWANVDANQLRAQIAGDVAKRGADMAAFDRDTKWAFDDLKSVNSEINALQKRPDLLIEGYVNPVTHEPDPSWRNKLQELKSQKDVLLNQIWTVKGRLVPTEEAPRRGLSAPPNRGGKTSRAMPSFDLRSWKADHPNATADEAAAKRRQYAGRYTIIE